MKRGLSFWSCAFLGLALLLLGLAIPAHLRAVDGSVIQAAGRNTSALVDRGQSLARNGYLGAAELVLQAARIHGLADWENLAVNVNTLAREHADWEAWGGGMSSGEALFTHADVSSGRPEPLTDWGVRLENRDRVLGTLAASSVPAVQELLQFRTVTNTTLFPPSASAAGQALDAAISVAGLLLADGKLSPELAAAVSSAANTANRGGGSTRLEQMLMDLMSLGQRLNWGQLSMFVSHTPDPETLRLQANLLRKAPDDVAVLFSAVELSGNPAGVAHHLVNFGESGLRDLGWSLGTGRGGINELLKRNQQLYVSSIRPRLAAFGLFRSVMDTVSELAWRKPDLALTLKWLLYLLSGFFVAAALHFAWPPVSPVERPLQARGFHIAREALFALGFFVVVVLLSEPFLAQHSQKVEFPFQLRLPTVGGPVSAPTTGVSKFVMNPSDLLPLLLFFTLQGLLYIACLVKLAEIRRQKAPARLKLKLLENEDHLFDAGLYLGFLGTIVSFILYSVGVMKQFSLMVAYSSTSFGIVFVSIFKILHLRRERRKLVVEAEAVTAASEREAYTTTS